MRSYPGCGGAAPVQIRDRDHGGRQRVERNKDRRTRAGDRRCNSTPTPRSDMARRAGNRERGTVILGGTAEEMPIASEIVIRPAKVSTPDHLATSRTSQCKISKVSAQAVSTSPAMAIRRLPTRSAIAGNTRRTTIPKARGRRKDLAPGPVGVRLDSRAARRGQLARRGLGGSPAGSRSLPS
jgi:hypothetical protein